MKTIVKLSVLVATLLLMTNIVFAQGWCNCYEYRWTNLDTGESGSDGTEICFSYYEPMGMYNNICGEGELSLFFDMPSLTEKALASGIGGIGYLTFHGDFEDFAGIFDCMGNSRYRVKGTETDNCTDSITPP